MHDCLLGSVRNMLTTIVSSFDENEVRRLRTHRLHPTTVECASMPFKSHVIPSTPNSSSTSPNVQLPGSWHLQYCLVSLFLGSQMLMPAILQTSCSYAVPAGRDRKGAGRMQSLAIGKEATLHKQLQLQRRSYQVICKGRV